MLTHHRCWQTLAIILEGPVQVACAATQQLVLKDFANERDPQKLQRAGRLAAQALAGGVVLAGQKDTLRAHFVGKLRSSLSMSGEFQDVRR